ncbi:MAG: TatD family deoxyribonuclease [Ruminococcaceae bacterium]|nr:TatD family deoxyribonuclease [Oscillospiraceae bacterium]
MGIFETHAHYLKEDFGDDLIPLLESMPSLGVEKIIAVGYDLRSSAEEIELAHRFEYIRAAAGVHPENCYELPTDWVKQLEAMLADEKVCALGEIGLDYHYDNTDKAVQAEVFERQLELARRLSLPVIIHSRDACEDTMNILKKHKPRGVLHCFSGSAETAAEVVKLGMYIGFTGVLTFKNAKKALAACEAVPLDRLLLETDCPYMAPVPHRGKRCDSSMIQFTAAKMAEIKGVSTEEMIDIARQNAERLFGV